MKALDFNLPSEIKFDFDEGLTTFGDSRLLIFDAGSIGLLRQTILELVGMEKAQDVLFRFGFKERIRRSPAAEALHEFDSEMDLLASGPVIHTWEGIVSATPSAISFDRASGDFAFTGIWRNSYEAEQYLSFNDMAAEAVCWSLTDASGWCTAFWASPFSRSSPSAWARAIRTAAGTSGRSTSTSRPIGAWVPSSWRFWEASDGRQADEVLPMGRGAGWASGEDPARAADQDALHFGGHRPGRPGHDREIPGSAQEAGERRAADLLSRSRQRRTGAGGRQAGRATDPRPMDPRGPADGGADCVTQVAR